MFPCGVPYDRGRHDRPMTRTKRRPKSNRRSRSSRQDPIANVLQLKGTDRKTTGEDEATHASQTPPNAGRSKPSTLPNIVLIQARSTLTCAYPWNHTKEFHETFDSHPATKARSTRTSLPDPRRKSTRAKTKSQNSQARDPNHIKAQITSQEQRTKPRRGVPNPARSDKGSSEEKSEKAGC